MGIDDRTAKALSKDALHGLRSLRFCVVGCSGTGANFAELLVRTGARQLTLIDGALVKASDLNRAFGFCSADVGAPKVQVLKHRLESIRGDLDITYLRDSFRAREAILPGDESSQEVRNAVFDSDVVFIATDTNTSRIAIVELCQAKRDALFLSCGVFVDRDAGVFEFECVWLPKAPREQAAAEGYGPENASFASLVHEATSTAFTMLLSHLTSKKSDFRYYRRKYDATLRPIETDLEPRIQEQ